MQRQPCCCGGAFAVIGDSDLPYTENRRVYLLDLATGAAQAGVLLDTNAVDRQFQGASLAEDGIAYCVARDPSTSSQPNWNRIDLNTGQWEKIGNITPPPTIPFYSWGPSTAIRGQVGYTLVVEGQRFHLGRCDIVTGAGTVVAPPYHTNIPIVTGRTQQPNGLEFTADGAAWSLITNLPPDAAPADPGGPLELWSHDVDAGTAAKVRDLDELGSPPGGEHWWGRLSMEPATGAMWLLVRTRFTPAPVRLWRSPNVAADAFTFQVEVTGFPANAVIDRIQFVPG